MQFHEHTKFRNSLNALWKKGGPFQKAANEVHGLLGRIPAGDDGDAISFCSSEERDDLRAIERLLRQPIPVVTGHSFHDSNAQHATGAAARRPPRGSGSNAGQRHGPRGQKQQGPQGFKFRNRRR